MIRRRKKKPPPRRERGGGGDGNRKLFHERSVGRFLSTDQVSRAGCKRPFGVVPRSPSPDKASKFSYEFPYASDRWVLSAMTSGRSSHPPMWTKSAEARLQHDDSSGGCVFRGLEKRAASLARKAYVSRADSSARFRLPVERASEQSADKHNEVADICKFFRRGRVVAKSRASGYTVGRCFVPATSSECLAAANGLT